MGSDVFIGGREYFPGVATHDLRPAADAGMPGSIDASQGNPQNGWDTDPFPVASSATAGSNNSGSAATRVSGLAPVMRR
jgi:xylose isomerase